MSKIFRYECRRLLLSKFFFGLVAVTCFYGWQVLEHVTILGIAHTAPFSPWSFGDYLSRLLPLLWLGTLFSVSVYTNGAERRAAMLTQAAPMHPAVYRLARFLCVLTASALLSLTAVFTAVCFYARMFRWHDWGTLVFPALVTLRRPSFSPQAADGSSGICVSGSWSRGRFFPSFPRRSPCRRRWDCGTGNFSPHAPCSFLLWILRSPFCRKPSSCSASWHWREPGCFSGRPSKIEAQFLQEDLSLS